jgi:arylsulfatase A-like enzyme
VAKRLLEKRWPWLVAAALIVAAFLSTVVELRPPADPDPRPSGSPDEIARLGERRDLNLLFVLIDTLRADRLGSYGYARDTSPNLDRLAASGVRFARHLAQSSWTKCSMASLWTGLYPARTGVTRYDDVVSAEARLPAEILKEAGFRTVGIFRNGWVAPTFGFEQGFDVYARPAARPIPPSVRAENPTLLTRGTDEDAVAAALEFLRVYGNERWFLYLHLMDVHEYLYDQESALFGGTYSDIYDNSIRWVDGTIAVLLEHLAALGLAGKTLVVIGADHGEAFLERGFEGHARRVFRETTEVPLLLFLPFRLDPGVVVSARTRNVDLWPTVLDLLGLEAPPGLDGRSLVPEILASARGEAAGDGGGTAIAHLDQNWGQTTLGPLATVAVAEGRLRYVRSHERGRGIERLFDSALDPRELDDRSQEEPEALARLRGVADAYLETKPPWGEAPKREIDELELNQLRALGYAVPGQ